MMSVPIEACGICRADAIDEPAVIRQRVRTPHRDEHRIARMLQRKMKVRRKALDALTRSTISSEQSMGSSELMRTRIIGGVALDCPRAARAATTHQPNRGRRNPDAHR